MIHSPFHAQSTAREVIAGHDLSGKTALVTGAASGIGLETARALLSAGAEVVLAVRDTAKGAQVVRELGSSQAHLLPLDLGSLQSVRRAAEQFLARWPRLDLLINNAGIMLPYQGYTVDGFEQHFGVNHLGHFLLADLLRPALQAAAPARLVVLTSSGHARSDIHFEDIQYRQRPYDRWQAYGQSKTANALFAVGFSRHFAEQGLTANAVHPGFIWTGLQKHLTQAEMQNLGWLDEDGNNAAALNLKTPQQGASTSVWAAVGPELAGIGGRYLEDCQEAALFAPGMPRGHGYQAYALDPERAERLWTLSQELVS